MKRIVNTKNAIVILLLGLSPLVSAQEWDWDDDIYTTSSERKTRVTTQKKQISLPENDVYIYTRGNVNVDVDSYNRRSKITTFNENATQNNTPDFSDSEYAYTDRIVKFHRPQNSVTISSDNDINIYVVDDKYHDYYTRRNWDFRVGFNWGYSSLYPWYSVGYTYPSHYYGWYYDPWYWDYYTWNYGYDYYMWHTASWYSPWRYSWNYYPYYRYDSYYYPYRYVRPVRYSARNNTVTQPRQRVYDSRNSVDYNTRSVYGGRNSVSGYGVGNTTRSSTPSRSYGTPSTRSSSPATNNSRYNGQSTTRSSTPSRSYGTPSTRRSSPTTNNSRYNGQSTTRSSTPSRSYGTPSTRRSSPTTNNSRYNSQSTTRSSAPSRSYGTPTTRSSNRNSGYSQGSSSSTRSSGSGSSYGGRNSR